MATEQDSKKLQSPGLLQLAASLSSAKVEPTRCVPLVFGAGNKVSANTVRQGIKISFFFEGTGNGQQPGCGLLQSRA